MTNIFSKVLKTIKGDELKNHKIIADKILKLDNEYSKLSNEDLKNKTQEFKNRLAKGETLDDILIEAYATVREASYRTLNMKHFKVQLIGGIILHNGDIAEMKTGEGKTLVATLPAYLNALNGQSVHVVTVNDYLAERDMNIMRKVYEFLGLSVSCIIAGMSPSERKKAYSCDIIYGTNNEFGFDYLKDNMVMNISDIVQKDYSYAIIDEVDSILIDEARTPLIISTTGEESTDLYEQVDKFVKNLSSRIIDPDEDKIDLMDILNNKDKVEEEVVDYIIDEKNKSVNLTEKGIKKAEKYFQIENLADIENMEIAHHINQSLKAHGIFKKDVDYVIEEGEVLIVDEFTGRIMKGRRYSDGIHQAIEAKEGLEVKSESQTLATITLQNYFRMYDKISGMTGTAKTEEDEFKEIYDMNVYEVPTNKPVIRKDEEDAVFLTYQAKFDAIVEAITEKYNKKQPVLVGTVSIETSEVLSTLLNYKNIPHEVLNAKSHMKEAEIIAQAGRIGSVTIATNMAGRGTDIILGGNPEFLAKKELRSKYNEDVINLVDSNEDIDDAELIEAKIDYTKALNKYKKQCKEEAEEVRQLGGLCIIGTERHESRRIDNQLRGRAGRQGDPGESIFFVSMEDYLMRLFGGDRVTDVINSLNIEVSNPLQHKYLNKSIEGAQKKIEGLNFSTRKYVLQYDNVINQQRNIIYNERKKVLNGEDIDDYVKNTIEDIVNYAVDLFISSSDKNAWSIDGLNNYLDNLNLYDDKITELEVENLGYKKISEKIIESALKKYSDKEDMIGSNNLRDLERIILLRVVDERWRDHIDAMDQLREGIGLRSVGQVDPVQAYQFEGFDMFEEMNLSIREDIVKYILGLSEISDEEVDNQKLERIN